MKIKDKKTVMAVCIGAVVLILVVLCIWLIPWENNEKSDDVTNPTVTGNEIEKDSIAGTDESTIELENDVFVDSDSVDIDNANNKDHSVDKNNNNTSTGNQGDSDGGNGGAGDNGETSGSNEGDELPADAVVLPEVPIP